MRWGSDKPKQFQDLGDRPMIEHCLLAFERSPSVASVIVVLPADNELDLSKFTKVQSTTTGGPTRQASLAEGLICLPDETDVVVVHDAARPFVSRELIDTVVAAVDPPFDGALAALPLDDALREADSEMEMIRAASRSGLYRAQTPQAFTRGCIEESLHRAQADGFESEDCSELAIRAGFKVKVVSGDPLNLKITRPVDLALAEAILAMNKRQGSA